MFIHNLTVALRNQTKYKTQSIVSILGLAAGFACFSLTAMWIRYENSFDDFHPKGDRIYRIILKDKISNKGYYEYMPDALSDYLKANFPEVEDVSLVHANKENATFELFGKGDSTYMVFVTGMDSAFIKMFDLPRKLITQLQPSQSGKFPIALRQDVANLIAGKGNSSIGMQSVAGKEYEVRTILPEWNRSEIRFGGISLNYENKNQWQDLDKHVYVLLRKEANEEDFKKKIKELKIKQMPQWVLDNNLMAVSLHDMHKVMPRDNSENRTKFEHIRIFALAGLMVILCALFNYLVLFIVRLKMRGRELALRKVNGASDTSLMGTLLLEFGLVLLLSLFVGEYLVKISLPFFLKVSDANIGVLEIYKETLIFAAILYLFTLLMCILPIYYFRRKTLYEHLHGKIQNGARISFQKAVLVAQLMMSTIMIIATTVIFLQLRYLQSASLGFNPNNTVSAYVIRNSNADLTPLINKFEQLTCVNKACNLLGEFFPNCFYSSATEVKPEGNIKDKPAYIMNHFADSRLFDIIGMHVIEGRIYHPEESHALVINESAKKILNRKEVVGSMINGYQIVGVVADCYTQSPLVHAVPTIYRNFSDKESMDDYERQFCKGTIAINLNEGILDNPTKKEKAFKEIEKVVKNEMPDIDIRFSNWNEDYIYEFLTSEKNLAKLFSIVSIICLLISIFGIYSLASLTCEQRRKEIAIRKINGATMKDILNLFFKEFFILLGIAIVIAFPIGYYVMHLWLEQYSRQVPMGPLLFLGIALALALVIILTIIFRVWRAASANPAQVIKENN